jgi:CheY-like chemotaxis protein
VMDGFTLVERMRADPGLKATPVLMISAGGGEARERAAQLGIDIFFEKPIQFADVIDTVSALLRLGK